MNLASVMRQESKLLLHTYDRFPVLFSRGKGVYLFDQKGKRYLDFLSGIGVNALGYSHPALTRAIAKQSAQLVHICNLFYHPYQAELAARLTEISGLDRVFFSNSGTEAWEGALKLARASAAAATASANGHAHTPQPRILAMENSFHGRTFGSLATTGQPKYRDVFAPLVPGVEFVRFNDVADLKAKFDSSVGALCLETIQGEGGVRAVSKEFLLEARRLTKRSGALLLLDEIQCGLGRTGKYFAYQHYGITPDIVTIAKPLAGGLPLGAIITTKKVADVFHPGMHGTTFGGGPLACSVALTFLDVLKKEKLLKNVAAMGEYMQAKLEGLRATHSVITDIRAYGLMVGLQLDSPDLAKQIVLEMLHRGIIINRTNDNVLRFLPPFIITKKHIDQLVTALDAVLSQLTRPV